MTRGAREVSVAAVIVRLRPTWSFSSTMAQAKRGPQQESYWLLVIGCWWLVVDVVGRGGIEWEEAGDRVDGEYYLTLFIHFRIGPVTLVSAVSGDITSEMWLWSLYTA